MKILMRFLTPCLLMLASFSAPAQGVISKRSNVAINANCNGYLEYLPDGYATHPDQKYPMLVFFMGINSHGPGTDASLQNLFGSGYMQDQMANGTFPDSFTVNGQSFKYIVIIPQLVTDYNTRPPTAAEVDGILDYMVAHYRVDTTRIYLTGNSSGGGPVFDYTSSSSAAADRIAAIVPFGSVSFPSQEKANILKYGNVAIWAFHNLYDNPVWVEFTTDYINFINTPPPPARPAKATIFPVSGHDCWNDAYARIYEEDTLNIYEWMLQFSRTVTKANAGPDQDITLPVTTAQLNGTGTGPNGTATSWLWQKLYGPSQGSISNATIANPVLSNLTLGTYIYLLTITDNTGATATDSVAITVFPERYEAENWTAMSGVTVVSATDGPSFQSAGNIETGDWMEYTVNVPVSGTYRLRYRVSAWYQNPQFVVKNSSGTVLATAKVYYTTDWEKYITMEKIINLPAGQQTLRFESTGEPFNFNWFQLISQASNAPLPVQFDLLNAQCVNGGVKLLWRTAGEANSSRFSVEKSTNGTTWTSLASVPAAGQSNTPQSYTYTDLSAGNADLYRIVEYAADGRKTISSILRGACSAREAFAVFPNPVQDRAVIDISITRSSRIKLLLFNSQGSLLHLQETSLPGGISQLPLNMTGLPTGSYLLQLQWDNERRNIRLIKK